MFSERESWSQGKQDSILNTQKELIGLESCLAANHVAVQEKASLLFAPLGLLGSNSRIWKTGDKIFCFPDSGTICFCGMDLGVWRFPDKTSLVAAEEKQQQKRQELMGDCVVSSYMWHKWKLPFCPNIKNCNSTDNGHIVSGTKAELRQLPKPYCLLNLFVYGFGS